MESALDGVVINIIDYYYNEPLIGLLTKADITKAALGITLRIVVQFIINVVGKITEQENHFDARPMKDFIHYCCMHSINFTITRNFLIKI